MTIREETGMPLFSVVASAAQRLLLQIVLLAGSVMMLIPFLWMVSSAFKQESQIFTYPPQWIRLIENHLIQKKTI